MVSDFARAAAVAEHKLSVGDDAAADSRAERQQREILRSAPGAERCTRRASRSARRLQRRPGDRSARAASRRAERWSNRNSGCTAPCRNAARCCPASRCRCRRRPSWHRQAPRRSFAASASMTALNEQVVEVELVLLVDRSVFGNDRRRSRANRRGRRRLPYAWPAFISITRIAWSVLSQGRLPPHGTAKKRSDNGDHRPDQPARSFARTGQPTHPEMLDARPMEHVKEIEITEEHITMTYNQKDDALLQCQRNHPARMGLQVQRRSGIREGDRQGDRALAQAPQGSAGKHRLPAGLRRMLQRLRAVRQPRRRAAHRRSSRNDRSADVMGEYVVKRRPPTATTSAGCAKSPTTSPTTASFSWAQKRPILLRHLRGAPRRLPRFLRRSAAKTSTRSLPRKGELQDRARLFSRKAGMQRRR